MTVEADSRRRPGRPSVGVRVPVRLSEDVLADVDRRAQILGRSRAAVIRTLLDEALGRSTGTDDGVDRAQVRRMLAMSPRERIKHLGAVAQQTARLRGSARRMSS